MLPGVGSQLAQVRADLLAAAQDPGRPDARGTLQLPAVHSAVPLREPPADVTATIAARTAGGLEPTGPDHPRGSLWPRVVAPAAAAGGLDALMLTGSAIAWGVSGSAVAVALTVASAVVGVLLAGLIVLAVVSAARDPLRITEPQLRALDDTRHWQSSQAWFGPVSATPERHLVGAAADAARRIVQSPAWTSPHLDDHRIRLDLIQELDEIDAQAFGLAQARTNAAGSDRHGGTVDRVGAALLERIAVLELYARRTVALEGPLAALVEADRARLADPLIADLVAGGGSSELATESLGGLTDELAALHAAATRGV